MLATSAVSTYAVAGRRPVLRSRGLRAAAVVPRVPLVAARAVSRNRSTRQRPLTVSQAIAAPLSAPAPDRNGLGLDKQIEDPWEDPKWTKLAWTVYRGEAYDLGPFLKEHPGGNWLLRLGIHRDSTALVESYHLRPEVAEARFRALPKLEGFPVEAVPPSPRPNDSEFYNAIRNRVRTELFGGKKHGAHRDGGAAATFTILGSACFAYCLFATAPGFLTGLLLGLTGAWIGLTLQHCANHGAMSNSVVANKLLGVTDDLIGGSSLMWRYHHQVSHHIHCNDNALDEDVFSAFPLLRFDARLPRFWFHKFQHVYMWVLFPFMLLSFHLGDIQGVIRRETAGSSLHGASTFELATVILGKMAHFGLIAAPALVHGWQAVALGYAGYLASLGVVLSSTFAVSHNVAEAKQEAETSGEAADRDWGRQQLMTSANWGGVVGNFFTGGLNLQIEHHLFPAICFVHYPAISKIVRQEAEKRGWVYQSYVTLPQILAKFVQYMKETGEAEQRPMVNRVDLTSLDTGARGRFTPMPGQEGCPLRLVMP